MNLSTQQLAQIERTCRAHFVAELHLIGSVLRDDFRPDSDLDLLVEFDVPEAVDYLENYFGLIDKLQNLLSRKVDLVANRPFKNPVFAKQIRLTKKLVYGKAPHPQVAV